MTERYSDRCTDRYTYTPREGKGPEGKGRDRKGRDHKRREAFRGGPFHHIVTYVTREIVQPRAGHHRDVVVSATRLDASQDLTTIEHLDFEPVIPCVSPARGPWTECPHASTADYIVAARLPCIRVQRSGICRGCWVECEHDELYCCGDHDTIISRDEALAIVEVLR